jgi:hypothetical protein
MLRPKSQLSQVRNVPNLHASCMLPVMHMPVDAKHLFNGINCESLREMSGAPIPLHYVWTRIDTSNVHNDRPRSEMVRAWSETKCSGDDAGNKTGMPTGMLTAAHAAYVI